MKRHLVICTVASLVSGTISGGQLAAEPNSAIPWLSESLKAETGRNWQNGVGPLPGNDAIDISPLDDETLDGKGILPQDQTGFPKNLWGKSSSLRVRKALLNHEVGGVPEVRAAFIRILLAETTTPLGSTSKSEVLLTRVDRLMELGALDQAEALLKHTGYQDHEQFRRAFDVAILTERTGKVCRDLRTTPSLSPTLPARIFCLARSGDWNAAEITMSLGREIGDISPEKEEVLAWFLDPQLFEGEKAPPIPDPITALDYVMRDAVALPRPSGSLPLAFLHIDIHEEAPMRARIEAGERLVRSGVVAPNVLFHAYRAGKPAASGGVWDRADVVQKLDRAFGNKDISEIEKRLEEADYLLSDHGLRLALAMSYADNLSRMNTSDFSRAARNQIFELLLLAGETSRARDWLGASQAPRQQLLLHLIDAETAVPDEARLDDMEKAAYAGLDTLPGYSEEAEYYVEMASSGQTGIVLLKILEMLSDGLETDPGDLRTALHVLNRIGLSKIARRIALETLLLQPRA